jgi:hypothetical protein
MDDEERVRRFEAAFHAAYEAWRSEVRYTWRRYKPMVRTYTAVGTVRRQVVKKGVSPGFRKLYEAGRLDLTMEALVLQPDFAPLFDVPVQSAARQRLRDHGAKL